MVRDEGCVVSVGCTTIGLSSQQVNRRSIHAPALLPGNGALFQFVDKQIGDDLIDPDFNFRTGRSGWNRGQEAGSKGNGINQPG